ncbi:MAG: hypothetical protein Q8M94_13080, partial [Ignavibacteria bacterium]|nr:hypothetical protein [Ignavibacteria bacterium]
LLMMFLSGCLQVNTKVNINKDGSGTIEETVVMKNAVIEMMKQFAMSFDSTKSEEFNMFKEEELKSNASKFGEGVKYIAGEKYSIEGFEGYKVTYAFSDINKIKLSPSPQDKVPFGNELNEPEDKAVDDYLKFNFTKGDPSILVINFPKPQAKEEVKPDSAYTPIEDSTFTEEAEQKMMEMFDGMKMSIYFNFKDGIDETDASFVNGSEVTLMQFDFSEIIKNKEVFKNFQNAKPETMEEFKKVVGDVEGIKIEFKDKVTIKF